MNKRYVIGGALATAAAGAALQRHIQRAIAADPERAALEHPPQGRPVRVTSKDGTVLHAEVFGREDSPTIVLAHGWIEGLELWIYQIRELSPEFRIVVYNLRGHGRSERAVGDDYSFDRFGEDVEAVLSTCVPDDRRSVLVGHSMGAMSIVAWAEHHEVERRIAAAALLNTGIGDLLPEQLLVPAPEIARALHEPIGRHAFLGNRAPIPRFSNPIRFGAVRYAAFERGVSPAKVAFYERLITSCPASVRAACGIAMADMDLTQALPRLTVPTLVMCGADDKLTPPVHAHRIAEQLPNLHELIELPATGHIGPLERPHEVSEALRKLAAGHIAERPRAQVA